MSARMATLIPPSSCKRLNVDALTKEARGQKWPFDSPNGWDLDAARFLAFVQRYPMMWLRLSRAKYLEMRIDTRDCGFNLYDRDKNPLSPDDVMKAVEELKAEFPTCADREYRADVRRGLKPLLLEIDELRDALHIARGGLLNIGTGYAITLANELGQVLENSGKSND